MSGVWWWWRVGGVVVVVVMCVCEYNSSNRIFDTYVLPKFVLIKGWVNF